MVLARSRDDARGDTACMLPTSTVGRIALLSVALMILVAATNASLAVTVPAGIVMVALWLLARWGQRDRGLLLVLPLVFGLWILIVPFFLE